MRKGVKVLRQDQNYAANTIYLICYSLIESILFLVVGFILSTYFFCYTFLKSIELTNRFLFLTIRVIAYNIRKIVSS